MSKVRLPRFIALLATTAAAVSLIGIAIGATGAYFTDSKAGQISGNMATLTITTVGSGGGGGDNLNFVWGNMLPGVDSVANVHVQNTGSVSEDVYIAFKNDNGAWSAINTYGAYAVMTVNGNTYSNLNNQYAAGTAASGSICGGTYPRPAISYLPHVVSLGTLGPTASHDFTITFRWVGCVGNDKQGLAMFGEGDGLPVIAPAPLQFKVAAFQVGINPNDPYNGVGVIPPLTLPYLGTLTGQLSGTFQ